MSEQAQHAICVQNGGMASKRNTMRSGRGMQVVSPGLAPQRCTSSSAKLTKKASLGSLAIAIGLPVTQIIIGRPVGEVLTGVGLCAFVVWRHIPNLKRLAAGNETSLKTK